MPVVSSVEFLKAARKGGYAIGGYNTNNLEWTQALLTWAAKKHQYLSKLLWAQLNTWVVTK